MSYALVTGATSALGQEFCRTLASRGYKVIMHYHNNEDGAERLSNWLSEKYGVGNMYAGADLIWQRARKDFANEVMLHANELSVIVHNAGWYADLDRLAMKNQTMIDWNHAMKLNLEAVFDLNQRLLPIMSSQKGRIIMMGDCWAQKTGPFHAAVPYHISKLGLYALMRAYAKEFAGTNTTVNMISPGFLESSVGNPPTRLPGGAPVPLESIVQAFEYLLDADHVTGANIQVSDGWRV